MFHTLGEVNEAVWEYFRVPTTGLSIVGLGNMLINVVIGVSFAFSIISVGLSMVFYILSGGNPDKTKVAWNAFLYGFIAACLSIALIGIRMFIFKIVGVSSMGGEDFTL